MHELLAERDFVRLLARQLVAAHDADDLEQDTWLAMVARPTAGVQRPQSWLARVMQNLAANRARTARRRAVRERAVGSQVAAEAPSTADILVREQVRQRVVAAVLALDEPFRRTVLARYYECLDSEAIAAREGIAVATVRSRMKRGLERLRAKLDADHGGERAAWATPLVALPETGAPLPASVWELMTAAKKVAALAASCLLVGLGCWWAWPAAGDVPSLPTAGSGRGSPLAANASTLAPTPPAANVRAAPDTIRMLAPREATRYPLLDEPSMAVTVRVLDRATRRPVAGAEVLFEPRRVDMLHERTRGDRELHEMKSSEHFLDRFAHRTHTTANGEAILELPCARSRVLARLGDRRGEASADPRQLLDGERLLVWLDEVRWVRLRVVDEVSRAPVAGALLDVTSSGDGAVVPVSCGYGRQVGPSDADGMIRLQWEQDRTALRVRPWICGRGRYMPLDLPAALDRVTEVPYPTTGSLAIELRTPSGELWPTRIEARVEPEDGEPWSPLSGPISWCAATAGTYVVPHVCLGGQLRVFVTPVPEASASTSAVVRGPMRAGESVRVVLHTAAEPCIVVADVRTGDGAQVPHGLLVSVLQDGDSWDRQRAYGPLRAGRIGWTVAPGSAARGQIQGSAVAGADECWSGTWQIAAATPGTHELGTIVLQRGAVVVSGTVVHGDRSGTSSHLFVDCEIPGRDGEWQLEHGLGARVRADGSFEVRGSCSADRVRVALRGDRRVLAPAPIVVARGARDVRIVVGSSLPVRARVLPPSGYLQSVSCRAARTDGGGLPRPGSGAGDEGAAAFAEASLIATDGEVTEFAWPALPPGVYTIAVHLPGLSEPVHVIDGVRVEPGVGPDPRLDAIDLRTAVRMLTVAVASKPDIVRPITDGGVLVWPAGHPTVARQGLLFAADGRAQVAIGQGPVDVLVAVPGCRLWRAEGVTESVLTVQLEPRITVPFRLAPRVAAAFAGREVVVSLEAAGGVEHVPQARFWRAGERSPAVQATVASLQMLADDGRCILTDSFGRGALPVAAAGMFRLRLQVRAETGWLSVDESWSQGQRSPLTPREVAWTRGEPPPIVIDVETEVLAQVVDALSRSR